MHLFDVSPPFPSLLVGTFVEISYIPKFSPFFPLYLVQSTRPYPPDNRLGATCGNLKTGLPSSLTRIWLPPFATIPLPPLRSTNSSLPHDPISSLSHFSQTKIHRSLFLSPVLFSVFLRYSDSRGKTTLVFCPLPPCFNTCSLFFSSAVSSIFTQGLRVTSGF